MTCAAGQRIVAALWAVALGTGPALGTPADTEPWSMSPACPVIAAGSAAPRGAGAPAPAESLAAGFGHAWLRFYQGHLSGLGTVRCRMTPSCSRYSMAAIEKHGLLIGVVMTADRLLHEADEKRTAPLTAVGRDARYLDPVANNDFWWCRR